jgi:D-alanine-D-alanine ligase
LISTADNKIKRGNENMENRRVLIIYNQLSEKPTPDEQDVLDQVELVKETLIKMRYEPYELPVGYNIIHALDTLKKIKPYFVFNLFESIENKSEFLYFVPALINSLHIPYTGFPLEALFLTTNKVITKQQLNLIGIPTAKWFTKDTLHLLEKGNTYIVKTVWEEGSLGLDEHCIFQGSDIEYVNKIKKERDSKSFFVEEYIEGRELNVSLLGSKEGVEVLPLAEIIFTDYPEDKYKMVGYKAKWVEDSFEYNNTPRTFDIENINKKTVDLIGNYCTKCWNHFGGRGYARIDFRLSKDNIPYVLEINGNPCITPGGGFFSAVERLGYTFTDAMERIIADAFK